MRIKFKKGYQKKFIDSVLLNSNCPSLRSLISRGFDIPYSTLKSYYNENRTLPEEFFKQMCILAGFKEEDFSFKVLREGWGQVLGGEH